MEVEDIKSWLEAHCSDVSIIWKTKYSGTITPQHDKCVVCYNIQDATEKGS